MVRQVPLMSILCSISAIKKLPRTIKTLTIGRDKRSPPSILGQRRFINCIARLFSICSHSCVVPTNMREMRPTEITWMPWHASDAIIQPRPQGLLAFQYGGGRREDPGIQRTKTIADWCIPLRFHTCGLIGLFVPKQRWLPFEGFVEAEKCFLQCLRPTRRTEFRSDCSENCDCTVGRQRFEYSDIWNGNRWEYYNA